MYFYIRNIIFGLIIALFLSYLFSCASGKTAKIAKAPVPKKSVPREEPLQSLVSTQKSRVKVLKDLKEKSNDLALPDSLDMVFTQGDLTQKPLKDETGPRFTISAQDVAVKTILFSLSREIDQNILIDPDVNGLVSVDLKDVSLKEALEAVLSPLHIQYTIDPDNIQVEAEHMETRIFHMNYIISTRTGSSNIQSSGGSQISRAGITGSSGGAGYARTTSNLTSQEVTDLWNEITEGLQSLLTASSTSTQNQAADATIEAPTTPTAVVPIGAGGGLTDAGGLPALLKGGTDKTQTAAAQQTASGGFSSINRQSGVILVRDYPDVLMKVAEYLEAVEGSSQRQVFIQAKILEIELNGNLDWTTVSPISIIHNIPTSTTAKSLIQDSTNLTYGLSNASLNLVVNALAEKGKVSVLSSPKISTLNNQRAIIKVGKEAVFFVPQIIPSTTTSVPTTTFQPATVTVGLVLDVLPQINSNGEIMMSINTSISERTDTATSPDGLNQVPILNVRESSNVVLAQTGQTIIIGGLIQERGRAEIDALPLLSDIPLLGRLFERKIDNTSRSELVIMLTPEVMVGEKIDDRLRADRKQNRNLRSFSAFN